MISIGHCTLGPQKTFLTADVAAAATSSTVENMSGFALGEYVVFGEPGEEKTEIVLLTSVTASTTLGHTTGPVFAHAVETPIYEIGYNQIEVYWSATESGTYALLTTIGIAVDQKQTVYEDPNATTARWYKIRFKDVADTLYSPYSVPVQGTGWTSDSLRGMVDQILAESGFTGDAENRERIRRLLNNEVKQLTQAISKLHTTVLTAYTTQSLTVGTYQYDLPTRFLRFKKIDISFAGGTYYRAWFQSETEGLPADTYYTTSPYVYRRGSEFGILPESDITSSGVAKLWYDRYPSEMYDSNDTHGLPYGASDILISKILYRLWVNKSMDGPNYRASSYKNEYETARTSYLTSISEGFQDYNPPVIKVRDGGDLYGLEGIDY